MKHATDGGNATARPVGDRLFEWTAGFGRRRAVVVTCAMIMVLSIASVLAGSHFSFAALFMVPIALAAWTLGRRAGLVVGLIGAAVQLAVVGGGAPYSPGEAVSTLAGVWNTLMRVVATGLLVLIVSGFRRNYDELRRRARTDALTGALNKQAFEDRVETTLAIARRHNLSVVLAYADLDGFKAVNDSQGHAAGDAVLKRFAAAAKAHLRPTDSFARAGGDEFMALLPVDDPEHGYAAVTRLHRALTAALNEFGWDVGCSMGAVVLEDGGADETGLVQLADALMYEVKRSGKGALRMATIAAEAPRERSRNRAGLLKVVR